LDIAQFVLVFLYTQDLLPFDFIEPDNINEGNNFPDEKCQLIFDNCDQENCPYYNLLCQTNKEIAGCSIYACQKEYKAIIKEKNGESLIKTRAKPNLTEVNQNRENCQGRINLLSQNCSENKMNLEVKLITKGECPISNFIVKIDREPQMAQFAFDQENNIYRLVVNKCGEISQITAVSQEGFSITD